MAGFQMCALCLVLLTLNVAGTDLTTVLKNINKAQTEISGKGSVEVGDSASMRNPEAEVAISGAARHEQMRRASRTSQDSGTLDSTMTHKAPLPKQYNMKWGGAARLDQDSSWLLTMFRPEAVHSEACDPSSKVCAVCDTKAACWHGTGTNGAYGFNIAVPSDTAPKDYAFSLWASCKNGLGGDFILDLQRLTQNAKLSVYLNGKFFKSMVHGGRNVVISKQQIGDDAQIKVVASRRNVKDHAGFSASVSMSANVPQWVDTCMDTNFCLKGLGDGTAGAFELRNNNRRQYECLQGKAKRRLKKECDEWRACFATQTAETGTNHETDVRKVLSAVFEKKKKGKRASLLRKERREAAPMKELLGASSSSQIEDAPGCTDPAAADVEAIECECLDVLRDTCAAKGVTDIEECFLTYMCDNVAVCDSWKADHCPGGGSLLMQRSSVNTAASATLDQEKKVLANRSARSASTPSRDDLDGALSGKCSQ